MSLTLKNPKGWFAAGKEVANVLTILSDGAFKLFVYLCLNAQRETGVIEISQTALARNLKKAHGTVRRQLREMEKAGICRTRFDHKPHGRGVVEIVDSYWPYQRTSTEARDDGADLFIAKIKKILQARACVRASFSTADEILARQWFDRGIAVERIEKAILMGCLRKYVSWRNNQSQGPIVSLRYFASILDEIENQQISSDYWDYLTSRLVRIEKLWIEHDRSRKVENPEQVRTKPSTREVGQSLTK
jgi:hypothetical protein